MRLVSGIMSLLVVLAVVGILVKKQLHPMTAPPKTASGSQPVLQSQQVQQQVKKSMEDAMRRPGMVDPE